MTAGLLLVLVLSACRSPTPEESFRDWARLPEAAGVADYQAYLRREGVADAVPMNSLLRSARHWRACDAAEFAVPPRSMWPRIVPTLRALQRLQAAGLVDGRLAVSGYRNETLNACAGGSSRSRHLSNNALDLDIPGAAGDIQRLCAYWRKQGPAMELGLGFYTKTRIHLDTSGFRTWGSDHTWRTSLCTDKPQATD
jgi:uncharacterized protein YcbK (DUF882 family)